MDIDRVILFISAFSQNCKSCVDFVAYHRIPVMIIPLDSTETRLRAMRGKYFQVHNVPALLVTYTDGNLQLFQGQPKILEWLNKVVVQRNAANTDRKIVEYEEEEEEEQPQAPAKAKKSVPKKAKAKKSKPAPVKFKSKKKSIPEETEDDSGELLDVEIIPEDEEDEPPSRTSPPAARRATQPPSQKTNSLALNGTGTKGKSGGMASLIEQARKMEEERKSSLGYDEKSLPRHN